MNSLYVHVGHHGSITIVSDNEVIVHTQQDRFSRFKNAGLPSYPLIKKIVELGIKFDKIFFTFLKNENHFKLWHSWLKQFNLITPYTIFEYDFRRHHFYHAMCSRYIYSSAWDFMVCDEAGADIAEAYETESFYQKMSDQRFSLRSRRETNDRSNIGHLYSRYTEFIGFGLFEEGKTMALSSYGKVNEELYDLISNGWFMYSDLDIKDIAATLQKVFEDYTFDYFNSLISRYSHRYSHICLTGGFAQNIINNTKIQDKVFNTILPDPMNGDFGISLGAAFTHENLRPYKGIFMGFNQSLDTSSFYNVKTVNVHEVAEILMKEPVAIFQSRSEQGQRALGNRSLLMNPLHKECLEKVNKIKKREWFRPFAGTVLAEDRFKYFDIPYENNTYNPYMMFMYKIKDKRLKNIASIDQYSRVQTLTIDFNPNYYKLIKEFSALSGVPIVLNTSLNMPGHTIVETLDDVKEMMAKTSLKYCYLPEINKLIINDNK